MSVRSAVPYVFTPTNQHVSRQPLPATMVPEAAPRASRFATVPSARPASMAAALRAPTDPEGPTPAASVPG